MIKVILEKFTAISILRVSSFCVFIGRAWQHWFWDAPFRALLWDESLLKGLVESVLNMDWQTFVTSERIDGLIQTTIQSFGLFYFICAFVALFIKKSQRRLGIVFLVGSGALMFLAFLYTKEKFFHVGQYFEYTAQFMTPIFLYFMLYSKLEKSKFILAVKIAVALTFICHGLYAVGYYPQPGNFTDMVINSLGCSEPTASLLLKVAGVLDFVMAALLFFPVLYRPALYYLVIWGLLTSVARIVANLYLDFFWESLHQWWFEVFIRLPHVGLPLLLLFWSFEKATQLQAKFTNSPVK